jgi:serine protease Do
MTSGLIRFVIKIAKAHHEVVVPHLVTIAAIAVGGILAGAGTMPAHAQTGQPWSGFADVVDRIRPSVISVRARRDVGPQTAGKAKTPSHDGSLLAQFFHRFGTSNDDSAPAIPDNPAALQGTGFFVSEDGYAVTNNHVIEGAKTVEVTTDDGKVYLAKVLGTDRRSDIALIKVDDDGVFPTAKFEERIPRVGDWVLAIGNPFGFGGSVTGGIVSARGRDLRSGPYDDFIQIDAPINQGNSGGPSFDVNGNVIGVNTAIVSPSGGSVGIAFVIPADTVRWVISQLREKGRVTRGWINVQIQGVTPDIAENLDLKQVGGVLVAEPRANGPAMKAGIEAGDVISAINGHQISDAHDFVRTVTRMAPGTSATFDVISKGQAKMVNITLAELPNQPVAAVAQTAATPTNRVQKGTHIPQLGLAVAAKAGSNGVVVTDLNPNGLAADYGFETGDVILEVAGKKIGSVSDIRNAIQAVEKSGRRTMLMRVKSGEAARYVTWPVTHG